MSEAMEGDEEVERPAADTPREPAEKAPPSPGTDSEVETTEEPAEAETEETADEADDGEVADDDSDDDATEEEEEDEKPKRKSWRERMRERETRLRAEVEQLRRERLSGPTQSEEQIAAEAERRIGKKPPKQEDFPGDYLEFEHARRNYDTRKIIVEHEIRKEANDNATRLSARIDALKDEHNERLEAAKKYIPDFDEFRRKAEKLRFRKDRLDVALLVLESKKSVMLENYFTKNEGKLDAINQMSPEKAGYEIGRIEARLSLPASKTQTQARKPVVPLKGGASPTSQDTILDSYIAKKYGKR